MVWLPASKKLEDMFTRFDTIRECERHQRRTDRRTQRDSIRVAYVDIAPQKLSDSNVCSSLFTENGSNYTVTAKQTAGLNKLNYTIIEPIYNA